MKKEIKEREGLGKEEGKNKVRKEFDREEEKGEMEKKEERKVRNDKCEYWEWVSEDKRWRKKKEEKREIEIGKMVKLKIR